MRYVKAIPVEYQISLEQEDIDRKIRNVVRKTNIERRKI